MGDLSEKWIAVVNPKSGSGKTGHLWEQARSLLSARGIDFEIRVTERVLHAVEIVRSAAEEGFRRFIAVGGDGTVNEVLGGIMFYVEKFRKALEDFTLAVIPIGSGNDWIRSHNVPLDVVGAVDLIAEGSFAMQDVFKAVAGTAASAGFEVRSGGSEVSSGASEAVAPAVRYMANIGGIGYDSNICDTVNGWKEEGRRGSLYVKSLIYNFLRYKGTFVEVECDGEVVHSGATFTIAFGNGRYCGGGLVQVPEARFDDGLVDVTIVPSYSKLRILSVLPKFFAGRILEIKGVIARKARSIVVRPLGESPEVIEIDGEILGRLPLTLEVCPGQLRVLHKF